MRVRRENRHTDIESACIGDDPEAMIELWTLKVLQVDRADVAPGQFAWMVRQEVEKRNVRVLILDSLFGYLSAMPEEKQLLLKLHERRA